MARDPKIKAPPVMMKTYIVRLYKGNGEVVGMRNCPTREDAEDAEARWFACGRDHYSKTEEVLTKRRLRSTDHG